jgi:hypothetical protein
LSCGTPAEVLRRPGPNISILVATWLCAAAAATTTNTTTTTTTTAAATTTTKIKTKTPTTATWMSVANQLQPLVTDVTCVVRELAAAQSRWVLVLLLVLDETRV